MSKSKTFKRVNWQSPGEVNLLEKIILVLFTIGYWVAFVFLQGYVIKENVVLDGPNGIPLDMTNAIWPLGFFLWGIITIILNATFRKK